MQTPLIYLLFLSIYALNSCKSIPKDGSDLASLRPDSAGSLVTQKCILTDSSPLETAHEIIIEVSEHSQLFRVIPKDQSGEINVIITNEGVTAYQFEGLGVTGMNASLGKVRSLREIFSIAKKYSRFNGHAAAVVAKNKIGEENQSIVLKTPSMINISLGYELKMGNLEPSFFWQASSPNVVETIDGLQIIPAKSSQISLGKPPYLLRFFSQTTENQNLKQEWYEQGIYPKNLTWSFNDKNQVYERKLSCKEPLQDSQLKTKENHQKVKNNIDEIMADNIVISTIKNVPSLFSSESTLEQYAQLSGMTLVDNTVYTWNEDNFSKVKEKYLKGSLLGVCLRFQLLIENEVGEKLCSDPAIKSIFQSKQKKTEFISNLQAKVKLIIDQYGIEKEFSTAYPNRAAEFLPEYWKLQREICVDPLTKIFDEYESNSCDNI